MSEETARALAERDDVLLVEEVKAVGIPTPIERDAVEVEDIGARLSPNLDRADQRALPLDGVFSPFGDGEGIHVFVHDTGFREMSEWTGRYGVSFTRHAGPLHDHGAHVAGTVGGTTYGVAKQVTLHSARVLDGSGRVSTVDVIAGLDWARETCDENEWLCVHNLSLGGAVSPALDDAICAVWQAGQSVAVAAGNDDANACRSSPARVKQAVTLGATTKADRRAWFSNHGGCVDVFAVGVGVNSVGGSKDGTSMASPCAAGALALCLQDIANGASWASPEDCLYALGTRGTLSDLKGSPDLQVYVGLPTP
jgi:subtilisin family serine protease